MGSSEAWLPQRAAVRREMKKAGINQAEMARRIGITAKHISQMLTGKTDGRVEHWAAIAAVLGMDWQLVVIDPNAPLTAWVQTHLGITLQPWQAARLRGIVKDRG